MAWDESKHPRDGDGRFSENPHERDEKKRDAVRHIYDSEAGLNAEKFLKNGYAHLKKEKNMHSNSSKMKTKIKLGLQFFAEKGIESQGKIQIQKGIRTLYKRIKQHEEKISNPKSFYKDWDNLTDDKKESLIKHWKDEIDAFKESIEARREKMKEMGWKDDQ